MTLDTRATAAGVRLVGHDLLDSTNAEALRLARQGERGPLWITAVRQSAGRGRRGRAWVSESGNLHATLLLTAPAPMELWPQLSFVAALATFDAVAELAAGLAPQLAIKWPNDLLLRGAKFAGILIEGQADGAGGQGAVAVGIGVDCASHPPGTDYPTIDLAAAGAQVSPAVLLDALALGMLRRLAQWNRGRGFPGIRAEWIARAAGLGEEVLVRLVDREIAGRFDRLDDAGALVLRLPDGKMTTIAAGDVFMFAPFSPATAG